MTKWVKVNQREIFLRYMAKAIATILATWTGFAHAIPEQCVRMPNQTNVCEHLIYKTVKNLNADSIVGEGDLYCVCLQDFSHLILPAETASEREQQKLDIENITRVLDITEEQLLKLIRY
jgi:HJR/Mrr/RecB family endonuclease